MVCLLLSSVGSFAQRIITGKVLDETSRQPLPSASVTADVNGKVVGVSANQAGEFRISLPQNITTLSVSMVGYEPQTVNVQGRTNVVVLLAVGEYLEEVVVTALGLEHSAKTLGYSVQKVAGSTLNAVKSTNFIDNLAGRISGVTVTGGSTGVGSSSRILIRGESSFTNNNPLFVVDGIPINNSTVVNYTNDAADGFQEVDFGNGAMAVNPDDIESVSVLKGPAAAGLYGTRAASGVIIIKTKSAARNKAPELVINSTTYVDTPFRLPRFQNSYGQGNSGAFSFKNGLGAGVNDNITYSYGPPLDAGLLIPQFDSPVNLPDGQVVRGGDIAVNGGNPITPTPFVSHPDNLRDFYQTGLTSITNVAFGAGSENLALRLSLTNLSVKSIIPGVDLQRQTIATAFSVTPVKKLTVSSGLNYVKSGSKNRPATKYGSENVNYTMTAWLPRQADVGSLTPYWQPGMEGIQQFSFNYTYFDNPYFTLYENRNGFSSDRLYGNVMGVYDFTENLSLHLRSGMDYQSELRTFRRAFSSNRFKSGGYAEQTVLFREINTDFLLNYRKSTGILGVDAAIGANRMDQRANTSQTQTLALVQPGIYSFMNADTPLEYFQGVGNKRINSWYGMLKLRFREVFYLDITGRNDWSSSLATPQSTKNTSFFYPSFSGSLLLSNWLKFPPGFSFVQLRGSYGEVGLDTQPFQTVGTFVPQTPVLSRPSYSDQSTLANPNLLPERLNATEIGLNLHWLKDKVKLDVTYFSSLAKNQLIALPIPISTGYTQKSTNGGAVRTNGWEATLELVPFRQKDFTWNSLFNFTTYCNRVEQLPADMPLVTLGYNRVYDNQSQTVWYQVESGGRMGDMYGTGYLKNANGDFILTPSGQFIADNTLIKLGNYNPDFIMGWSNNFVYKNVLLSFLVDWRQGGQLVSRTQTLAGSAGQLAETAYRPADGIVVKGVVNVGTPEIPRYVPNTTPISAETYYRQYYDRNQEENNTLDASYVKLREVQLGTQLPSRFLRGAVSSMTISVIGRNVWALSKIKHFDPEQFSFQGQKLLAGVEDMTYATSRSIGLKLGLTF